MLKKLLPTLAIIATLSLPSFASAITLDNGLSDIGNSAYGGANTDPAAIVGNIISIVLGALGVVFLILTIYAGFLWMTAAGNDSQVKQAKSIIVTAVIGLVIILAAYSITSFVVDNLSQAIT